MPRKKKVSTPGVSPVEEENAKLRAELAELRGKKKSPLPSDGAVTFKSPWPAFRQKLRKASRVKVGYDDWATESPVFAEFENQVCTLQPGDTFTDSDGKTVRKIDRMREIYRSMVAARRRPHFIEVTDSTDLRVQSFRERVPPAQLVEFKGPLVDLPTIPPPPPEARETMETLEGKRRIYGT